MRGAFHHVERHLQHVEPHSKRALAPERAHRLGDRSHQLRHGPERVHHLAGAGDRVTSELCHPAPEGGSGPAGAPERGREAMAHRLAELCNLALRLTGPVSGTIPPLSRSCASRPRRRQRHSAILARTLDEAFGHSHHTYTVGHGVVELENHTEAPFYEPLDTVQFPERSVLVEALHRHGSRHVEQLACGPGTGHADAPDVVGEVEEWIGLPAWRSHPQWILDDPLTQSRHVADGALERRSKALMMRSAIEQPNAEHGRPQQRVALDMPHERVGVVHPFLVDDPAMGVFRSAVPLAHGRSLACGRYVVVLAQTSKRIPHCKAITDVARCSSESGAAYARVEVQRAKR